MSEIWEKLGMERTEFRDHPQRAMLIRRVNGVKIFSCCEWAGLIKTMSRKWSEVLLEIWFKDEAEKQAIREKYPHAIIG